MHVDTCMTLREPRGVQETPAAVSFGRFEALHAGGAVTDRTIRSMLVTARAGNLADLPEEHERGPGSPPSDFDASRHAERPVAPQMFDPACREELRLTIAADLPTLEALLDVPK